MQAITYHRYGPPDVLAVEEVPTPVPAEDEVLIRVCAAEATKADCEMRSFRYSVKWFWLPLRLALGIRRPRRNILGGYFAGVVTAVGENVTDLQVGEEVFAAAGLRFGAYGEYLALPASYPIAPKPANMSFAEAAAVPLGGQNALHFMRLAGVQPGETVLINGAGGSIGLHGVMIAKAMGAEVTAVDTAIKQTMLLDAGADHFIDYQQEDFTRTEKTFDVIFDMVPGSNYGACMRILAPDGRYLSGNPRLLTMLRTILTNRFSARTARFTFARESRADLLDLKTMIEQGRIGPIVDRVFNMTDAATAHELVETEQRTGAVVIDLSS